MVAQGRLTYRYFEGDGLALDVSVGAFAGHYRVTVLVNGAPARTARRRDFDSAVRWGRDYADHQLNLFGLQPRQLPLALPAELPAVRPVALAAGL
ncbi:MAG: hypothetical protein KatS3mg060_2198 [Dehalococcoidia bacterium]|jgi:hypothetical protein|nr:MAG: hypothetical protein KatS3mg060_2198 [Dehalococcoidia bacterium]